MNKYLKVIIQSLALSILLSCSKNGGDNIVNVSVQGQTDEALGIKISKIDMLNSESISIAEAGLDSLGKCSLKFTISKPTLATLEIGHTINVIYLEPGQDLNVSFSKDSDITTYSGKGSEANNYLSQVSLIRTKIEENSGRNIYGLNQKEFLNRLDTLEKSLNKFHQDFIDSVHLPLNVSNLLEKGNMMILLVVKQAYGWNYGSRHNHKIPEELDVANKIPIDSMLLDVGMREYASALHMNMYLKFYIPLQTKKISEENEIDGMRIPLMVEKKIYDSKYPSFMEEFLLAKNVDMLLTSLGITPTIDTVYKNFRNKYSTSSYLSPLRNRYDTWLAISPGKTAPDVKGLTMNGAWLSLNDLKGKIVYIDVWATWCGPCRDELPYAKKLQKKFENNNRIVFLYVSVDRDQEVWKKMLQQDPDFKGTHIIEVVGKGIPIRNSYHIAGIPRYILVNENGLIVNVDAPRPSSKEIETEIDKLLAPKN